MAKKIIALILILVLVSALAACGGESRIVHCDHCGDEIVLDPSSKIEEDWIVFCKTCEEDLFGDNPVVSPE